MSEITRIDVIAHQTIVPWPSRRQVEQDLLLCRAIAAIFGDAFLKGQVAMRGGTLLHKAHLAPAARYSEDIDLVVFGDRPEGHINRAIRRVLEPELGAPVYSRWENLRLAVRNLAKPSRVLRLTYQVPAVSENGPPLEIVVEANVTERTPHRKVVRLPFAFPFRDQTVQTEVNGFDIHEMLGTKMRALFQRRRGRDLFDLYWALKVESSHVDPALAVESFLHYLQQEGGQASQAEFIGLLDGHLKDPGFRSDMTPLLREGLSYDPDVAGKLVKEKLLNRLSR